MMFNNLDQKYLEWMSAMLVLVYEIQLTYCLVIQSTFMHTDTFFHLYSKIS